MIREYNYTFSRNHKPVARAGAGDVLTFVTLDCFSGNIATENDLITAFDYNRANPATGPVYVENAAPGDALVVDIIRISIGEQGVVTTLPEVGPRHDRVDTRTKVL
jgi:amidase